MKAVVINLKERKEKREYIQEHLISQGMKFDFMTVSKHKNPKRGCLESH